MTTPTGGTGDDDRPVNPDTPGDGTSPVDPTTPPASPGAHRDSSSEDSWLFGADFGRDEPTPATAPGPGATRTYVKPEFSPEELSGLADGPSTVAPRQVIPVNDEPSAMVGRYLFPTERYRGEWKRHPIHLAKQLSIAAGATLTLGFVSGMLANKHAEGVTAVLFIAWVLVMIWVGWEIADWFNDRFILTNKRVMVVNGIVTRKVAMMPLARVTDMKFEQSPLGRALNYGTFVLESAGQEQALREVKHLPNPNELYLRVVEEMYEPQAVEARLSGSGEDDEMEDDGS